MTQLSDLVTPALIVDRGRLLANISEMAARAKALGVALRPHAKTHKSPAIAALQRAHGATGLTVATLTEAEGFAGVGVDDLLVTAPPVGDWRLERLLALARRVRIRVAVDSVEVVAALDLACAGHQTEIGFVWEVDCGVGRFGTRPGRHGHLAAGARPPDPGLGLQGAGRRAAEHADPGLRADRGSPRPATIGSTRSRRVVVDAWPVATREWREIEAERRPTWSTR